MTREEQIKQKAKEIGQKYFPDEHNIWARGNIEAKYAEFAFIEGVGYADKNPKEGLVSLNKVCEWLKNNVYEYTSVVNHDTEETNVELTTDFESFDEFINAFHKAMEK